MNANPDPEQSRRRARRAFIRTHHPDAGGDLTDFVTGLAELDAPPVVAPPLAASSAAASSADASPLADEHPPPPVEEAQSDQPWPVSLTTTILRRAGRRNRPPRVR